MRFGLFGGKVLSKPNLLEELRFEKPTIRQEVYTVQSSYVLVMGKEGLSEKKSSNRANI
jgi:hypothetical protein